jgi:alpha-D-xyloside xylohydrolase
MMRPLWFDDPDDAESWNHPFQYRFGPDLIVAPVCWPDVDTVDVYLPPGEWTDVWSGKTTGDGGVVSGGTSWQTAPLYVRANGDVELAGVLDNDDIGELSPP